MTGIIKVDTIQNNGGTTGLTIDSGGDVTVSEMSCDQWRLTANFSSTNATLTGWERPDDSYSNYINGLSESSGVFTFSKTGLYMVYCHFMAQNQSGSADGSMGLELRVSTDSGSTYDAAALSYVGDTDTGNNNGTSLHYLLNVTDASTFRVLLETKSLNSGSFILGNTTTNLTAITFVKLAPAQ